MGLKFCSFASGSRGNSYIVFNDETKIIVDVGVSGKRIFNSIVEIGLENSQINGVVVTHEHSDHIKSVRITMKKFENASIYTNKKVWEYLEDLVPEERHVEIITGEEFKIGNILVKSFLVNHDAAEPVGYSFISEGRKVSIVTDTGHINDSIYQEIVDSDLLVLEANHDPGLVPYCRYPYSVKCRILGENGHLANEKAAECLSNILKDKPKPRQVMFAHLSRENNTEDFVSNTVNSYLEEQGQMPLNETDLCVLSQDDISKLYEV